MLKYNVSGYISMLACVYLIDNDFEMYTLFGNLRREYFWEYNNLDERHGISLRATTVTTNRSICDPVVSWCINHTSLFLL